MKMEKRIINLFGFILAWAVTSAQAVPTLFFDGDITYTASTGEFSVSSVLTATSDITPIPELADSSLAFSVSLSAVDASNPAVTIGMFNGIAGDDITVVDGNSNTLLTGEFYELELLGRNQRDGGRVSGVVSATNGSLASMFGAGNLFALQFNLSTVFTADMFSRDFTGLIDGRIEGQAQAVPEPGILAMLILGLAIMGFIRTRSGTVQI